MSHLVIFDIDGTLTKTNTADERCYELAVRQMIHEDFIAFEPDGFEHYTDSSIVRELYPKLLNRAATESEVEAFKEFYLSVLSWLAKQRPAEFLPVEGAAAVLQSLPPEWDIALATGCWRESAAIKLQSAGIAHALSLPKGTASDALSRADIMRHAIAQAKGFYIKESYDKIVYIGDGIWDYRTCAQMQMPFIGIEAEGNTPKRVALGKHWLLTDYIDFEHFVRLLHSATAPPK